ncbi:MAG TPA: hypothetical protein VHP11_12910 [Tepidisphaeraceae bacterium]|nr:hypothetical protein [Tepidisphaeraceae bacterium]
MSRHMTRVCGWVCVMLWAVLQTSVALGQGVPGFDFTKPNDCQGWQAAHDVAKVQGTEQGLAIDISGSDPYIHGPARDYPAGQALWMKLRVKAEQEGMLQIFYFPAGRYATEEDSVRLPVQAGQWQEYRVPVGAMGPRYHLRIDPPGTKGRAVISSLTFEPRIALKEPMWPKPQRVVIAENASRVKGGELDLAQAPSGLGAFEVRVGGKVMAQGFSCGTIGYVTDRGQRWVDLRQAKCVVSEQGGGVVVEAVVKDEDGGTWEVTQRFTGRKSANAIDVETSIVVDRDREVCFAPLLMMSAGMGTFGERKQQALLAGLEYLDRDEPSSSEADIIGAGAKRQVPDSVKLTMPLMTVLDDGQYVGLIWEPQEDLAAVFDSPDRLFKSGGHVMGLIWPGSDGTNRIEGNLLPHAGKKLAAGQPIKAKATIIGNKGHSVVDAVKQYVSLRGLPAIPEPGMNLPAYAKLAAGGWMDSKIREGNRYRHAYPGGFQPNPAADAALWMDWLAAKTSDAALAGRLREAAKSALAEVRPDRYNAAAVSHVRYPVASLLYGHVAENVALARQHGHALLGRFEPDGTVLYRASDKMDYGKTHFAKDANGLTSQLVMTVLEAASVSGDPKLITEGLRLLRAMDKFTHSVPRGAQTWECPLHTPDILASANLVHAYVRGYELTGDPLFLETARYWAWTGVPFVYLVNPANRPVGPYATIAVYGATWWKAPNWMGLPVQWCGLVYADALYQLALHDAEGPWKQLADGITASGIQQTWPADRDPERQGLLPDSFSLRSSQRNDAAINPGTVQANAVRFYQQPPVYSFHAFRASGLLVHVPGRLSDPREEANRIAFQVGDCILPRYDALIAGCKTLPRVRVNGADVPADRYEHRKDEGVLILHLSGQAALELIAK